MKLLFATLLCHRDVEIFKFNWFVSRMLIDHGFDQEHLILNDGTLTDVDKTSLEALHGVTIDQKPITLLPVPNPILTAKIQLFERGFDLCKADRVVIFDPDVFIYKPWDSVLNQILVSKAICLRDWGSSLGPNQDRYKELFGVTEDGITPNCNTGVYSIPKDMYHRIAPIIAKHMGTPFQIMEDQGIFFASFYGDISYIKGIRCLVNGIEEFDYTWSNVLNNNLGAHLQGMRVRPKALASLVNHCINACPKKLHLSQIAPKCKSIVGDMEKYMPIFGQYDFTKPYQEYPSQWDGKYVLDGMHMHGGSTIEWQVPRQCASFESQFVCLHTGIPENCRTCRVNGTEFKLGDKINIPLNGILKIETEYSEGAHFCFLNPTLKIKIEVPSLLF